jgi:hypothetical protein
MDVDVDALGAGSNAVDADGAVIEATCGVARESASCRAHAEVAANESSQDSEASRITARDDSGTHARRNGDPPKTPTLSYLGARCAPRTSGSSSEREA